MLTANQLRAVKIIKEALGQCEEDDISQEDFGAALLSEAVTTTVELDGCYKAAEKLFGISRMVLKWAKEEQR